MRISDWSSDVCSSDLRQILADRLTALLRRVIDHDVGKIGAEQRGAQCRSCLPCRGHGIGVQDIEQHDRDPAEQEWQGELRSEEHTSELQSLMRISYAVFCLKKKKIKNTEHKMTTQTR